MVPLISKHENFENDKEVKSMLISVSDLTCCPFDVDIRNVKTEYGHRIICHIQDEYGLEIDTEVIEINKDYYVNI